MYSSSSLNLEQKRNGESSIDNSKPEPWYLIIYY